MTDTNPEESSAEQNGQIYEAVTGVIGNFASAVSPVIPWRMSIWKKISFAALNNYYGVAPGDALGLIAQPGQQVDIRPIGYRAPKDCDEGEKPGWVELGGDKVWHAGAEGRVVDYLGDTPVVALERDSHVEAGWLKPRIAEAIELDNYDSVFTKPEINMTVDVPPAAGQAVADGGQSQYRMDVETFGQYEGVELVDLDSGDGYDGMRIDFRKASEWAAEKTTTEEMQMQEDRGYLRGKMAAGQGPSMVKLMLICAGIILGSLGIIILGPELIGAEGGVNPLSAVSLLGLMG